ncbi:MAG: sensor histidine kinase [Ktedonobacterales bacterium]|nr:sensor histidine kinase [Ktedonobacterales bacterium]
MQELTKAHRFVRLMTIFWNVVSYSLLTLLAIHTVTTQPTLLHTWRGLVFGVLIGGYGAWYLLGYGWMMGPPRVWQGASLGRRALYWLPLALLPLGLTLIDIDYVNLEWIAIGTGMSLLLPPWNIIGVAGALVPLALSWGIVPRHNTIDAWLQFALTLLTIVIYCAVIYLPFILVTQRFKQARLFADLQTAHADLAAAHTRLAASAAGERELAVLRERERLARDMHDTLGHALALTTVKLEAIRRLTPRDPERATRELDATEAIVRGAMGELRATLAALRTTPCLVDELRRLALAAGERSGMTVACDLDSAESTWPEAVQAALVRVGGEAIANAERHAHAQQLTLALTDDAGWVCLCITDDGVGLPDLPTTPDGVTSPPGHFGLAGMRERVRELGGALHITTPVGGGTTIAARIPLEGAAVHAPLATLAQVG